MVPTNFCRMIIMIFWTNVVNALPETSLWSFHLLKPGALSMQKSMLRDSEIHTKVFCEAPVDLTFSWTLLYSPCIEIFLNVKPEDVMNSKVDFTNPSRIRATEKTFNLACSPSKPNFPIISVDNTSNSINEQGLLTRTDADGAYMLAIEVKCTSPDCSMDVTVDVEMRNADGSYLSAVEFPFLPLNGILSLFYFVLVAIWTGFTICYWNDFMRIQFCIGFVVFLGLWEHLTLFAIYETVRKSGEVAASAVYFAEFVACVQRTLARILVLIACLGYGVTKPRLGAIWFRRCMLIGSLYFVLVTIEGMTRVSHARFESTQFRLATILPLVLLDVGIMWWIFVYLARTLRETRMRRNLVKHKLYRDFSYVLMCVSLGSIAFMVWSIAFFKYRSCIEHWRYLWIDDAFWQALFAVILAVIMLLWRPTPLNRQYAYSLLDATEAVDTGLDDEEEILLDRSLNDGGESNDLRSRNFKEDEEEEKDSVDVQKDVGSPLIPGSQGIIPATFVERMGIEATSGPTSQPPVWKID